MFCTFILVILGLGTTFAQEANDFISKGNKLYDEQKFGEAEMTYREGQESGADAFISGFNLGDALFKQERYEEAAGVFQTLPNLTDDKEQKAAAYHNLGNSFLKAEKYQESVDAFKQSLRNNPKDLDTKYNLAYAMRKLQKQQQDQQQNQDQNQDEKKDQDNKQDQQQNQDQKDQQKQEQPQPQEGQISKEDAERMLDALNQDEKQIRDRLEDEKKKKGVKVKIEKDW
ncbi:MAG: tetratricopeptide repeat protein [Flavobacteriales bacterium]|nr:tetratricopeptide repeat protein [Flavobacteriales bacterium]